MAKVKGRDRSASFESNRHVGSMAIQSQARVLRFELHEVEQTIDTLTATLNGLRRRRKSLTEQLDGLHDVLERR